MSRLTTRIAAPFRLVLRPWERAVKRKLAGLIDDRLEPVRADLRALNDKMDRILDLNVAPAVLSDFRAHNEALRAIQADCDLLRELNPMFNSFLRDLMRLQLGWEELSDRIDRRDLPEPSRRRSA